MEKLFWSILLVLFSTNNLAQSPDEQVNHLLQTSDFISLEEVYPELENQIQAPIIKALSEATLEAAFGKTDDAISKFDYLIEEYSEELGPVGVKNMLMWQCTLLFREGRYQESVDRIGRFVDLHSPHAPADFLAAPKGLVEICKSMSDEKAVELIRPNEACIIPITIDTLSIQHIENFNPFVRSHMSMPVIINKQKIVSVFDTGCPGGLFLSKELATQLGVRIKVNSFELYGAGGYNDGQIGILDSIQVGNLTLKNVSVTVMPSSINPGTPHQVDALLGSDIMRLAGEVQIFPRDKKIVFPIEKTPLPTTGRNMMRFDNGNIFLLKTFSSDEKLIMLLDTGDVYASFNNNFYRKHKVIIDTFVTKVSGTTSGIGGTKPMDYHIFSHFPFKVGDTDFKIEHMQVETEPTPISNLAPSGSLGMAFINSFDKVTISFDHMFVDVE